MQNFRKMGSVVLVLLLAGCVSTPYHRPDVPMPQQFQHATQDETRADAPNDAWWQGFGDPVLNDLVAQALDSNYDLAVAAFRVRQAQIEAGLVRLDQWPTLSGGLGASTGDGSTHYSADLSVSYEADLWGRVAAAARAADWEAQASEQDRQAARLSLIGTVCELYWQIAYTHQQITVGQANLDYANKVLQLVSVQHRAGSVSGVEMAEARQSVEAQTASLSGLQQQLVEDRAALAVVLGGTPWDEAREPQVLPDLPLPEVRAGLPAELLGRRPDLRAAELRLRENLADVDIAKASLYPQLSLTASGGASSTELSHLFDHTSGSLGASLSLPFLDYPRVRLNIKSSQAAYDIAATTFRKTLVQALADTDNALSARSQLAVQGQALAASLAQARQAEALYAIRYRAGSVPLRTWLDAQASLRQAQLSYDNNRLSQLVNQSTLYQALGGGA